MNIELAARFFGEHGHGPEVGSAVAEPDVEKISDRFPSPVSFGVEHGIGVGGHPARLQHGHVP